MKNWYFPLILQYDFMHSLLLKSKKITYADLRMIFGSEMRKKKKQWSYITVIATFFNIGVRSSQPHSLKGELAIIAGVITNCHVTMQTWKRAVIQLPLR